MKKIIPEKKLVICDFCEKEIYTNNDTGNQWAGVLFKIEKKTFLGLFGVHTRTIDLCPDCFKKLTGKSYTNEWEGDDK